jgi:transcriptional regulator with XRE-family HTH domain
MTTIERFKEYLNKKGITNARAEKDCGFSNGLIGNALKSKAALGSDKLEKILTVYADLSAEYLLRGTGSIFLSDVDELLNKQTLDSTTCREGSVEWYKHLLKELSKINMVKAKAEAMEKELYAKIAEKI